MNVLYPDINTAVMFDAYTNAVANRRQCGPMGQRVIKEWDEWCPNPPITLLCSAFPLRGPVMG